MSTTTITPLSTIGEPDSRIDPIAFLTGSNPPPSGPGDYYVLRVCGDSLDQTSGGIYDGDMLVVRRLHAGLDTPSPGEMCVAVVGVDATVRRYDSEEWREVKARARELGGEVSIQGVVCGIMRRF